MSKLDAEAFQYFRVLHRQSERVNDNKWQVASPELFQFWKCAKQQRDVTAWRVRNILWKSVVFLVFPAVFTLNFVTQLRRGYGRRLVHN